MEEDVPQATPEEIRKIASRVLKEAPPGEFDECVNALKGFVPDKEIITAVEKDTYRIWARSRVIYVTVGADEHKALICEEACLGGDRYIDPTTSKSFTYDFANKKTVTATAPVPQPPSISENPEEETPEVPDEPQELDQAPLSEEEIPSTPLREATQAAITKFTSNNINDGVCGVYDKDGGLAIAITGSSISKPNFRTGSVIFHFVYQDGKLEGTIGFFAHFFENGNAVSNQDAKFSAAVAGGDDQATAQNISKQLSKFYNEWVDKIVAGFDALSEEGLNKLRRRLPITKTQINWQQELIGGAAVQARK
jgi:capping protein alpha